MKIIEGYIDAPKGFYADGIHSGLKKKKKDLGWIVSEVPAVATAVYTMNQVKAAPILVTQEAMKKSSTLKALIVNSGSANACTGKEGLQNALSIQKQVAEKINVYPSEVAVASTGVIGQQLPMGKIHEGIENLSFYLGDSQGFHEAILTTDLVTKEIVVEGLIGGKVVTIAGVAKGSGMIHPNMATMLSFITTDAKISEPVLNQLLKKSVNQTYNQITVDGDTSTNDMVLVMANGMAENETILDGSEEYTLIEEMFSYVCETLAKKIASDGEGATKLIEVQVANGNSVEDSRKIAKTIVGSSLVKSAMFGEDPNWGRIICAIGYAGVDINPEVIDIKIGNEVVLQDGQPFGFQAEVLQEILKQDNILISVDLKQGLSTGIAWGCDLTYKYVEINACYHT